MRVIVTRPLAQAQAWVAQLRARAVDAQALPLIDIAPIDDAAALRRAWAELTRPALVVFVSPNAVLHFFAQRPPTPGWPLATLAACTGPGTAAALRDAGLAEGQIIEPGSDAASFDSEALWARLAGHDWVARRVLIVRGEGGRDWLAGRLRERGAEVVCIAAYRRLAPRINAAGRALIDAARASPSTHLWLFSSSEAVGHLVALVPGAAWSASRAAASHSRIAQTARAAGFGRVDLVAPTAAAVAALAGQAPIQSAPL